MAETLVKARPVAPPIPTRRGIRVLPGRPFWVWLHRYCGLAMAAFLVVVGLTGSLLAFNFELERVFAPHLFAMPRPGITPLDLATLAERAQVIVPHGKVERVGYTETDQVQVDFAPRMDPATGRPYSLGFTEFFIDPWTGKELGRRNRGDLSQGFVNLMPFLYELHWRLVAGDVGQWILGILALIWTLDCFNGFYLTLPVFRPGFWRRWRQAWVIKRGASTFRLNFDLHRAGGLWVWPLLLIFAWSSVMMDIRPVYERVMRSVFDYQSPMDEFRSQVPPKNSPRLDWRAAQTTGERLIDAQSKKRGFTAGMPLSLMYFSGNGAYFYEVRGSRDVFQRAPKGGGTYVMFDGDTGELRQVSQPTGEHTGNTLESWLYALHMARVFGRPYQFLVGLLGLLISMLSVTGIYIWWNKRLARTLSSSRSRALSRVASKPAESIT